MCVRERERESESESESDRERERERERESSCSYQRGGMTVKVRRDLRSLRVRVVTNKKIVTHTQKIVVTGNTAEASAN